MFLVIIHICVSIYSMGNIFSCHFLVFPSHLVDIFRNNSLWTGTLLARVQTNRRIGSRVVELKTHGKKIPFIHLLLPPCIFITLIHIIHCGEGVYHFNHQFRNQSTPLDLSPWYIAEWVLEIVLNNQGAHEWYFAHCLCKVCY